MRLTETNNLLAQPHHLDFAVILPESAYSSQMRKHFSPVDELKYHVQIGVIFEMIVHPDQERKIN